MDEFFREVLMLDLNTSTTQLFVLSLKIIMFNLQTCVFFLQALFGPRQFSVTADFVMVIEWL